MLERESVPGAPEAGLRLVQDEQHPAAPAMFGERNQIPVGQLDDAAGARNGFGDHRGEAADRLPVDHLEPEVELGAPVVRAVGRERGTVCVRGRQREHPGHRGSVASPGTVEGGRGGAAGDAVPRPVEGHHLEALRRELGHLDGRLVGLGAGAQRQHLGERGREQGAQRVREIEDDVREESSYAGDPGG